MTTAGEKDNPLRKGKHKDIAHELGKRIRSGQLKTGDKLPTFAELKDEFSVAANTVSLALSTLEKKGVVVRKKGSGIYVADGREVKKNHVIGIAASGFEAMTSASPIVQSYWHLLVEGVLEVAHRQQFELVVLSTRNADISRIDGVLLHTLELAGDFLPHIPSVMMLENNEVSHGVVADDFRGELRATQYLLDLGHRRIAYMGYVNSIAVRPRLAGYRTALYEAGIEPDLRWVRNLEHGKDADYTELGAQRMREWLEAGFAETRCTAILMQNDWLAMSSIKALQQSGFQVPQDISVVGFDGTHASTVSHPPLTTVTVPLREIGKAAATLLLRRIAGEQIDPVLMMLPTTLTVRESTAPRVSR